MIFLNQIHVYQNYQTGFLAGVLVSLGLTFSGDKTSLVIFSVVKKKLSINIILPEELHTITMNISS